NANVTFLATLAAGGAPRAFAWKHGLIVADTDAEAGGGLAPWSTTERAAANAIERAPSNAVANAALDYGALALRPGSAVAGGILRGRPVVVVNTRGDIAFAGDVAPATSRSTQAGVYLSSGGHLRAIVRPGDALPGGGTLLTASLAPGNLDLNNAGDIAFTL